MEEEISILKAVYSERTKSNIAEDIGINALTPSMFLKNHEKLQQEYRGNSGSALSHKRIGATNFNNIDKSVYKWLLEVTPGSKVRDFTAVYGVNEKFKMTQGWLHMFHSRHNIVFKGVAGEENSALQASGRDVDSKKC